METPFVQYLHTNYVPTPDEIDYIRSDLIPHSKELMRLEALICELSTKRDRLKEYIDSHQALISVPRRLPYDILQEIFLACLPSDQNPRMDSQQAPMLLCSISSSWRKLALSFPRLWSSLAIDISLVLAQEENLTALAEWLARAGACPLSLTVSARWMFDREARNYEVLMGILEQSVSRWHNVKLEEIPAECIHRLCDMDAPELAAIEIEDKDYQNLIRPLSWNILEARRLHTFKIRIAEDLAIQRPNILPMLSHLSHLSLTTRSRWEPDGLAGPVVLSILRNLSRLSSLEVELAPWSGALAGDQIHLPALNSLAIVAFRNNAISIPVTEFLDHLVMPQLHTLRIENPGFRKAQADPWLSLSCLAERSPHIDSLTVYLGAFTNQSFAEALQLLPALEILDVTDGSDPTGTFPRTEDLLILLSNAQSHVCPSLKNLVLRRIRVLRDEILLRFLNTRLDPQHGFQPLEDLRIDCRTARPNCQPDTVPDIQPFIARGVRILLTYRDV
ncbi:hypothetical protein C8J57DRAFT_1363350, partial [Mycena rebaudengoi]